MTKQKYHTVGTNLPYEDYLRLVQWCKQNGYDNPGSLLRRFVYDILYNNISMKDLIKRLEALEAKVDSIYKLLLDEVCDLREDLTRHELRFHFDDLSEEERKRHQMLLKIAKESKEAG